MNNQDINRNLEDICAAVEDNGTQLKKMLRVLEQIERKLG